MRFHCARPTISIYPDRFVNKSGHVPHIIGMDVMVWIAYLAYMTLVLCLRTKVDWHAVVIRKTVSVATRFWFNQCTFNHMTFKSAIHHWLLKLQTSALCCGWNVLKYWNEDNNVVFIPLPQDEEANCTQENWVLITYALIFKTVIVRFSWLPGNLTNSLRCIDTNYVKYYISS